MPPNNLEGEKKKRLLFPRQNLRYCNPIRARVITCLGGKLAMAKGII